MLDVRSKRLEQVGETLAMLGADCDRIAKAKAVGLIGALLARAAFRLVRNDYDGSGLRAKPAANFLVRGRQTLAPVDQKQGRIGIANRRIGLLAHPSRKRVRILIFENRGLDPPKLQTEQAGPAFAPAAPHPRAIIAQPQPLPNEPVEQRRFADVWSA